MNGSYANPALECDIIMKGGITSGVVYPEAVLELARDYRFRSIGGTSAGAIAAAITAAAEYGRDRGGFGHVAAIPEEMQTRLASLFQPDPRGRALFGLLIEGFLGRQWLAAAEHVLRGQWKVALGAFVAVILLVWLSAAFGGGVAALLAAVLGLILFCVAVLGTLACEAPRILKELDFGLCPGKTQPGYGDRLALSDWLAETIERAAGREATGPASRAPLTFGDLRRHGEEGKTSIDLRMMTTNLSMRRPHALPHLGERNYYFRPSEFRRIFPDWVVEWMVKTGKPVKDEEDLYYFPEADDLPVVVATRMSLSFPFLISAVPIWRYDFPDEVNGIAPLRRLLFSDGGLSSNFPIHFFDSLFPRRPTFGIVLDTLDDARPDRRISLPMLAGGGQWLEIDSTPTISAFVFSLLNAAKDWQDRLQSVLPGYRERIVHVYLSDSEGGLNLNMPPAIIQTLTELGGRAGSLLAGRPKVAGDQYPFDFDDHRWRRFLIAFARMEETLERSAEAWGSPATPGSFANFVATYHANPGSYGSSPAQWRRDVFTKFDALMEFARQWNGGLRSGGDIPKPDTDMRITPRS